MSWMSRNLSFWPCTTTFDHLGLLIDTPHFPSSMASALARSIEQLRKHVKMIPRDWVSFIKVCPKKGLVEISEFLGSKLKTKATSPYIKEILQWKCKRSEKHFYRNQPRLNHWKGSCYASWITMMGTTVVLATLKKNAPLILHPSDPVMNIWRVCILGLLQNTEVFFPIVHHKNNKDVHFLTYLSLVPVAKEEKQKLPLFPCERGCVQVPCYFISDVKSPLHSSVLLWHPSKMMTWRRPSL